MDGKNENIVDMDVMEVDFPDYTEERDIGWRKVR